MIIDGIMFTRHSYISFREAGNNVIFVSACWHDFFLKLRIDFIIFFNCLEQGTIDKILWVTWLQIRIGIQQCFFTDTYINACLYRCSPCALPLRGGKLTCIMSQCFIVLNVFAAFLSYVLRSTTYTTYTCSRVYLHVVDSGYVIHMLCLTIFA